MKVLFIAIILFFALFLETTFFSLPLVLLTILLLGVIFKEAWIFPVAFGVGILLDMLSFRTVGISSLFFIFMLGLIYLYQRKFEIQTIPFVIVVSLLSSWGFMVLNESVSLIGIIFSCILTGGVFWIFTLLVPQRYRL